VNLLTRFVRRKLIRFGFLTPRIYVGCSLTHSSLEFKAEVEDFKETLRDGGYEVLEFLGLIGGTAQDVYLWDIYHCVSRSDVFVAICDDSSSCLGYELAAAVEKFRIPVIAVAHENSKISRLILGITSKSFSFQRYKYMSEVAGFLQIRVRNL